jgi:membrane protein
MYQSFGRSRPDLPPIAAGVAHSVGPPLRLARALLYLEGVTTTARDDSPMRRLAEFMRRLARKLWDDDISELSAMLAYYALLSLFPMLVFVVTLTLLILPAETLYEGVAIATRTMPHDAASVITTQVERLANAANPGFAIVSIVLAIAGASRAATALSSALNSMAGIHDHRPWVRRKLTVYAVTLGVGLATVLALGLLVIGPVVGRYVADQLGLGQVFDTVWAIVRWVGAGLLLLVIWSVVYRFLPDTHGPCRVFTPGAVVGVALWLAISLGFGIYLERFNNYEATYGALGGLIIFLVWLWLSNVAILIGAEINEVLAEMRADIPAEMRGAAPV